MYTQIIKQLNKNKCYITYKFLLNKNTNTGCKQ